MRFDDFNALSEFASGDLTNSPVQRCQLAPVMNRKTKKICVGNLTMTLQPREYLLSCFEITWTVLPRDMTGLKGELTERVTGLPHVEEWFVGDGLS